MKKRSFLRVLSLVLVAAMIFPNFGVLKTYAAETRGFLMWTRRQTERLLSNVRSAARWLR